MKKNSFIYLIAVCFALFAGAVLSSCDDSKDDVASEGLSVKVFSPTKVIQGQEVIITGTGLDEVTSVVFPDSIAVNDIRVVTHNEIRVIAPAGISPDGGELTIHAGNESVTARVPVTLGNPSVATLFPGDKARIGTELTMTGTDMEFFEKAIFPGEEGDITVDAIDFVRKSTSLLKIKVPTGIQEGPAQIRLVTCAGSEVLLPEIKLTDSEGGQDGLFEGVWVWSSPAWGSGGYLTNKGPAWWSTSTGEELDEWGQVPGEGLAGASMVFSGSSMTKRLGDGTEFTGEYSVDMTKTKKDADGEIWAIGQLVTEDVTVLVGKWARDDRHEIYTYDIIEFTDDRIVLAYVPDGANSGAEAFFWIFERENTTISTYSADVDLQKGQAVTLEGIDDIADWWIDPDFFTRIEGTDNKFVFQAIDGSYRIDADQDLKYFTVQVLSGGAPATLNADGTGAIWVIGDGQIGKPTNANGINWEPNNALCLAPIGDLKYRITLVAGSQIGTQAINFKFFHQKGWGTEFTNHKITHTSNLILLGDGSNGADPGNLMLQPGVTLEDSASYEFVVDVSAGNNSAVLTVTKK